MLLEPGPLRADGRRIVDRRGRSVMLRGVNFSGRHKQPPFLIDEAEADFAGMQRAGFNLIRLVIPWEAIAPARDRYDDAYLDRLEKVSSAAGAHGIHVIMDMHQDIYSRTFGGSGAPEWTILPEDLAERTDTPDRNWFMRYATSAAVRRSLARFFSGAGGLQAAFIEAMVRAARRLATHPEVIGFEPFNEPFGGELDLEKFEVDHLQPFYARAIFAVREVAPQWIAFLEGALFASELGTKLELERFENVVYFPHFYDKLVATSRVYSGDRAEMERVLAVYDRDARRMNVPWMLGEFGIPADSDNAPAYLEDQARVLERYRAGGTCWQWNPTPVDWNEENMSIVGPGGAPTPLLAPLIRAYPRALAAAEYELESGTLSYVQRGTAESVIFVPGTGTKPVRAADGERVTAEISSR